MLSSSGFEMELVPLSLDPPFAPLLTAVPAVVAFSSSNSGTLIAEVLEDASQATLIVPPEIGNLLEIYSAPTFSTSSEIAALGDKGIAIFVVPHADADHDDITASSIFHGDSFRKVVRRKDTWYAALIEDDQLVTRKLNSDGEKVAGSPYAEGKPIYFFNGRFRVNVDAPDGSSIADTDAEDICIVPDGTIRIDETSYVLPAPVVGHSIDERKQVLWAACGDSTLHAITFDGTHRVTTLPLTPLEIAVVASSDGWDVYVEHKNGVSQLHIMTLEDMGLMNQNSLDGATSDQDPVSYANDQLEEARGKIKELEQLLKERDDKITELLQAQRHQSPVQRKKPSRSATKEVESQENQLPKAPKEATPKEATPKEATPKEATPKEATPKETKSKEGKPREAPKETKSKEAKAKKATPGTFEEAVRAAMNGRGELCVAYIEQNRQEYQRFFANAPLEYAQLVRLILINTLPGTEVAKQCKSEIGNPVIDHSVFNGVLNSQ